MKKMLQLMAALLIVTSSAFSIVIPGQTVANRTSDIVVPGKSTQGPSDIDGGSASGRSEMQGTNPAMAETTPATSLLGYDGAGIRHQ